jgi:glycolate oxidase FAD binding subunit
MIELLPRDEPDVVDVLASIVADKTPVEILGFNTKRMLGRPVTAKKLLRTDRLSGIRFYEPNEMVITVGAGTPLQEIVDLIDKQGQRLAFEPFDYSGLFGQTGSGSVGGMIAVNASGSRRIATGAARDHLLGFRAVNGHAKVFKSGGRVMKNVTGYDLSKLVSGSYGTLAVLTEVTLKVVPTPETEETLIFFGLDEPSGLRLLREASCLPYDVSGLAYFPKDSMDFPHDRSLTSLRIEGSPVSVRSRRNDLLSQLRILAAEVAVLDQTKSSNFWRESSSGASLKHLQGPLWKISTAPANASGLRVDLTATGIPVARHYFDWAGGLIWVALEDGSETHEKYVRKIVDAFEGHATLVRASHVERMSIPVFHPRSQALAAVYRGIKDAFDPAHVLNRGRLSADY